MTKWTQIIWVIDKLIHWPRFTFSCWLLFYWLCLHPKDLLCAWEFTYKHGESLRIWDLFTTRKRQGWRENGHVQFLFYLLIGIPLSVDLTNPLIIVMLALDRFQHNSLTCFNLAINGCGWVVCWRLDKCINLCHCATWYFESDQRIIL